MSLEFLSHTPTFELPPNAPDAPADLISLIEDCYDGLSHAVVQKMIRRGSYEQIAKIICQENPSKKSHPSASAEDIAEYCMMCMQYDIDRTDLPGTYKVALVGPPGKRGERSKHIDLGNNEEMARTKTMISEGDLIEMQGRYIGELHSQSIGVLETLHGMIKPLLQENKEMMKIISESARRLAEVERDRMAFDLQVRIHNDEIKQAEAKEAAKSQRWNQAIETIRETGALEGLMKALLKKINEKKASESAEAAPEQRPRPKVEAAISTPDPDPSPKKNKKSKVEKAKEKGTKKKSPTVLPLKSEEDEVTQEQIEEALEAAGLEKARENPNALMAEILKMTIDENEQWPIIQETLSEGQFEIFKKILEAENDAELKKLLIQLYEMKGARKILKLEQHLSEDQKKYVDKLSEFAAS
jgi:hypothetical protein